MQVPGTATTATKAIDRETPGEEKTSSIATRPLPFMAGWVERTEEGPGTCFRKGRHTPIFGWRYYKSRQIIWL